MYFHNAKITALFSHESKIQNIEIGTLLITEQFIQTKYNYVLCTIQTVVLIMTYEEGQDNSATLSSSFSF